jgi:HKD family nuclease
MNEKDSSRNYFIRGNIKLDLDIHVLLEVNSPDMENILPALADFIEETDRF